MANIKNHISKILLLLGTTATLEESCTPESLNFTQANFVEDQIDGTALFPIKYYMDNAPDIGKISSFASDFFSNPEVSQLFSNNPSEVLSSYGLSNMDLNDPQLQILIASADPEIQKSIKEQDFKRYLSLLEQKDLLQSNLIKQIKVSTDGKSLIFEPSQLNSMTKVSISNEAVVPAIEAVVPAIVAVVAALWVAVEFQVAVHSQVGIEWQLIFHINMATRVTYSTKGAREVVLNNIIADDDALMLYLDDSKDLNTVDPSEATYISDIRDFFVSNSDLFDETSANTIFKTACGTAERLIEDNNE